MHHELVPTYCLSRFFTDQEIIQSQLHNPLKLYYHSTRTTRATIATINPGITKYDPLVLSRTNIPHYPTATSATQKQIKTMKRRQIHKAYVNTHQIYLNGQVSQELCNRHKDKTDVSPEPTLAQTTAELTITLKHTANLVWVSPRHFSHYYNQKGPENNLVHIPSVTKYQQQFIIQHSLINKPRDYQPTPDILARITTLQAKNITKTTAYNEMTLNLRAMETPYSNTTTSITNLSTRLDTTEVSPKQQSTKIMTQVKRMIIRTNHSMAERRNHQEYRRNTKCHHRQAHYPRPSSAKTLTISRRPQDSGESS